MKKKISMVKSLGEYERNINQMKLDLMQNAMGLSGSWKASAIFLGLPFTLLLICLALGWWLMARILIVMCLLAGGKLIFERITSWRKGK